jgi:polar amino acid transport system substrate-binding protein
MDKPWLTFLLTTLCLFPTTLLAQDKTPLVCLTDLEGGIPYIFGEKDDPSTCIGFEVDLLDALKKELGRPITLKHTQFESLLLTLSRRNVPNSFAMNGLEITPRNRELARFTRPYYIYRLQLIARAEDDRFTTLDDCKARGLRVGTLTGSAAAKLLEEEGVEFSGYDDQEGLFKVLVKKNPAIDAILVDLPIALYYVVPDEQIEHRKKDYPGLKLVGQSFAEGNYGIAVNKDNQPLAKELDEALGRVIQSGELKRILTKWHLWSPDQYRLYTPTRLDESAPLGLGFFGYFFLLLKGAGYTVLITVAGMALAVAIGLPIATARLYGPLPLRWLATCYVEFFRGIPVLLLLYFLYYGLPDLVGLDLDALTAAIIGFGLNYAAYEAEIYRNGIQSVPVGQWEAAASLGMSPLLTFRRIIFPQSVRVILPPMTNDFIALFKDTSVVSIISVVELSKQYQILTKSYGGFLEIGLTTAALYLVMSVPLGQLSRYLEKRWGVK